MAEVIGFVDWLPQSRPEPRYPLLPSGSALVAYNEVLSQFDPIVQGHKYDMPNSSLWLVPLPPFSSPTVTDLLIDGTKEYIYVSFPSRFTYYCEEPS
jgi:hypothetical protein